MGGVLAVLSNSGATLAVGGNVSDTHALAANAQQKYKSTGAIENTTLTGGAVSGGSWILPTAIAPGGYTIRAHKTAGSDPDTGDSLDTDLALSSDRFWGRSRSGAGTTTSTLTITIKDAGGNTVATGSVVLSATAT